MAIRCRERKVDIFHQKVENCDRKKHEIKIIHISGKDMSFLPQKGCLTIIVQKEKAWADLKEVNRPLPTQKKCR